MSSSAEGERVLFLLVSRLMGDAGSGEDGAKSEDNEVVEGEEAEARSSTAEA